jgi:YgiT-type zinc finger domain-containing protein
MKKVCMACRKREVVPEQTSMTFDEKGSFVVFKNVPGFVCQNCGNVSFDIRTLMEMERVMDKELESGPKEEILDFASVA